MISPQNGCPSRPPTRLQRKILAVIALAVVGLIGDLHVSAQSSSLPVFPGAQGFGSTTRAAYGGSVAPVILRVTNLNDSGAGSLRAALTDTRPRVVIFEVSGVIALQSIINIMSPYITIAGATAPSPGISVRDDAIQVQTHDVLIQHLRARVGPLKVSSGYAADGFAAYTGSKNVVFDHLSIAWAVDGSIDISSGPIDERDITISNSLIGEHLRNAGGSVKQNHSRAIAVQNGSKRIAILRNVFAHVGQRLPFMKADTAAVIANNLIYDQFQDIGMYLDDPDAINMPSYASIVGNRWVQGPSSSLFMLSILQGITVRSGIDPGSRVYRSDNSFVGAKYTLPYRNEATWGDPTVGTAPSQAPLAGLTLVPSSDVEADLLSGVGARPLDRDAVDKRIISQIVGRTGRYVDNPSDVGGYPSLAMNTRALTVPANPHGLSSSGSGYTILEQWLHMYAAAVEGRGTVITTAPPAAPTNVRVVSN
jgi:hypothetical protein